MSNIVRTVGLSPKVKYPALIGLVTGTALVVIGVVAKDDTVRDLGVGVITSSLAGAGVGYAAPPADLAPTVKVATPDVASDDLLSPEAWARLDAPPADDDPDPIV